MENGGNRFEQAISRKMIDLGVPAHLKGYQYIRAAACMAAVDMEVVGSVTKLLYPEIARRYNTTNEKVERAIRNAIEISWSRGNTATFEAMFGYCRDTGRGRPTNSEYIAAIADTVLMESKAGCA